MSATDDRRSRAERLALVLTNHGMQRMAARVLAAFIFTERPTLTQGELVEELDAGTGSVSSAIKTLTTVGLIERVPAAASRRDHHRLREDAWATLFTNQNQALTAMAAATCEGIAATDPDSAAHQRLERMHDFYQFILAEIPDMIERWKRYDEERRPRPPGAHGPGE